MKSSKSKLIQSSYSVQNECGKSRILDRRFLLSSERTKFVVYCRTILVRTRDLHSNHSRRVDKNHAFCRAAARKPDNLMQGPVDPHGVIHQEDPRDGKFFGVKNDETVNNCNQEARR